MRLTDDMSVSCSSSGSASSRPSAPTGPEPLAQGDDDRVRRRAPDVRRHPLARDRGEPGANPAIEINVVDPIVRKGYRFKGRATLHTSDDMYYRGLQVLAERGSSIPRNRIRAIVIVAVDRAAAVLSTGLRHGGERGGGGLNLGSDTRRRCVTAGEARPVSAPPASRHLTRPITGAQATLGSAGPSRSDPREGTPGHHPAGVELL